MTRYYSRSPILSFWDLPEDVQAEMLNDNESAEDDAYVSIIPPKSGKEYLPMSNFTRTNFMSTGVDNNFTHGVYRLGYSNCYTITLNRSNDEAVVAYKTF